MRVIDIPEFGGPEVLTIADAPAPRPGQDEVLIKVAAAGINRADLLQRQGHYPAPPGASPILGMEVSGHIAQLGPEAEPRWKVGEPVCALIPGGGYAEYCVANAGSCLPVPKNVSLVDAAALPEAVFTVWANLFALPYLRSGERFLVHGGTSGIGTTAIQMATALGARVITTAGSKEKCDFCLSLGAERAFNYRDEDWFEGALEWSEKAGVDVILDMVGGDYFPKHLKLLAQKGRLIHIATTGGSQVETDLRLIMMKRLVVTGSTLRRRSVAEKTELRDQIERHVWPLIETGKLRPIVDRVFPLGEAAEAHRRMQASTHIGKLLLRLEFDNA
ncbi:NAD(P)H-quinone oxidoreductase [Alloacidobacterium dinghuense]|uniref:NAD(P)H-quinone oxidoreductase n=1 Tax=Alloacidobacterium dinghuense TaxID=2763107 RepID=A0A7G8BL84_9BACT|nr:NAD(P)H-quinone oxidoreductase [Alloacidobacterium dinghuense]QNI33304.1 NAD(P)H-quinone oxidoreductase [Alloacidobacterium dinghuense]